MRAVLDTLRNRVDEDKNVLSKIIKDLKNIPESPGILNKLFAIQEVLLLVFLKNLPSSPHIKERSPIIANNASAVNEFIL